MNKRKIKGKGVSRGNADKGTWRESWNYLKESRNYVYFAVAVFFVSSLYAFLFPGNFVFFDDVLKGLIGKIDGLSTGELIWFIFQNNITSAFLAMILGVFLGVFPFFNALTNGAILGYVYSKATVVSGFSSIVYLIPHGIFELPAIFIAIGLGMKLGMFAFVRRGKKIEEFKRRFWSSMKVFFTIVLPLLIIAAIIEGLLIAFG